MHAVHGVAGQFMQTGHWGSLTCVAEMMMGETCAAGESPFSVRDHQDRVHGTAPNLNIVDLIPDDGLGNDFLPSSYFDHIQYRDIGCINRAGEVAL